MPIPTRSQSVRIAAEASSDSSEHQEARKATRENANANAQPHGRSSALPQPQRRPSVASHKHSHSTTASSLPRPLTASVATSVSQRAGIPRTSFHSARETHQRSESSVNPTFNTYQQHYKPQKSHPKPRLQQAEAHHAEQGIADTQEVQYTSRLQAELLQLSLVHRQSVRTFQEFERSVDEKLGIAARKLRKEREVVSTLEAEYQNKVNALTINNWLKAQGTSSGGRKVEDLSFCVAELADLSGNDGLFAQLMLCFDQWLEKAQRSIATLSEERLNLEDGYDNPVSVDRPGLLWQHWVDECFTRLELCQRLLHGVGDAGPDSGIGLVLDRHRKLTLVMLNKLRTAKDIIAAVSLSQHQSNTKALAVAINKVTLEDGNGKRKGIWSVLKPG